MHTHDLIDNHHRKLAEEIGRLLQSTATARFATGYFFLSGFAVVAHALRTPAEIRLLIGNSSAQHTVEQLALAHRSPDHVQYMLERERHLRPQDRKHRSREAQADTRDAISLLDQTDEQVDYLRLLIELLETGKLMVRIYTRGTLHAKAYVFDYGQVYDAAGNAVARLENGIGIVGSSNLTLSGLSSNTELNVVVHGNDNHAGLQAWFDQLWQDSEPFDEALMQELQESWAIQTSTPYEVWMKTAWRLVADRLEQEQKEILWGDDINDRLADFQKAAVRQAIQMIRRNGGVFVGDVVGLGKSFMGAAIVKHFERTERVRPLIVCPAPLVDMWERYNEVFELNARVLSMGMLRQQDDGNILLDDDKYTSRDFLLIDESHNFRNPDSQRYTVLDEFLLDRFNLGRPVPCCFLTATPRAKSVWDIYHQMKLFHPEEATSLPIDPPMLKPWFKQAEAGRTHLPDLLSHLLIRRTRKHIIRFYGFDAETNEPVNPHQQALYKPYTSYEKKAYVRVGGKKQYFPRRLLRTVEYEIDKTYHGLYEEIRRKLEYRKGEVEPDGVLTYARYGLWYYVSEDKQKDEPYARLQRAGSNLRGLVRVLLFKRLESSVYAFRRTIERMIRSHTNFLKALNMGVVPIGKEFEEALRALDDDEFESILMDNLDDGIESIYAISAFDIERLVAALQSDRAVLQDIHNLIAPIEPVSDSKLIRLRALLADKSVAGKKCLIFTQYADTATYLHDNLNSDKNPAIAVASSKSENKEKVVGLFAPKANPEYRRHPADCEINLLITTDVLSEGLNLQDCNQIINYDLHWNPVRLIQRFGRIDRIGTEHDVILGLNFLPELGIEKNLGLKAKLSRRIKEIHETIGEDAAVLDPEEKLNEEAMYAIYDRKDGTIDMEDEDEDVVDLSEIEEILRRLREENPTEYDHISKLPEGIRSGREGSVNSIFVFCEARYPDEAKHPNYQQLALLTPDGIVITRDLQKILKMIRTDDDTCKTIPLSPQHNQVVMAFKRQFETEVKKRESERQYSRSYTSSQSWLIQELRELWGNSEDNEYRSRLDVLIPAYEDNLPYRLQRELNTLKRLNPASQDVLKSAEDYYHRYGLSKRRKKSEMERNQPIVRIVCSEGISEVRIN